MITPSEIVLNIAKDLFSFVASENKQNFPNNKAYETFLTVLEFSLSEWNIYSEFDLYSITISSLAIALDSECEEAWHESLSRNFSEEENSEISVCYEVIKFCIEKEPEVEAFNINSNNEIHFNENDYVWNYLSNSSIAGNPREIETNFISEEDYASSNNENNENENSLNVNSNIIINNLNITNKINYTNYVSANNENENDNNASVIIENKAKEAMENLITASAKRTLKPEENEEEEETHENKNNFCNNPKLTFFENFKTLIVKENEAGLTNNLYFQSPILNLKEKEGEAACSRVNMCSSEAAHKHSDSSASSFDYCNNNNFDGNGYCNYKNYYSSEKLTSEKGSSNFENNLTQSFPLELVQNSVLSAKSFQAEKVFEFNFDSKFNFCKNLKNNTVPCYLDSIDNWENDFSSNFFLKKKKNFLDEVFIEEKSEKDAEYNNQSIKYELNSTDEESPLQEKTNTNKFIKKMIKGGRNNNDNNNHKNH